LKETAGIARSGYVLRTGAAWAGTIGRAVIRMHYGEVKRSLMTLGPMRPLRTRRSPTMAGGGCCIRLPESRRPIPQVDL